MKKKGIGAGLENSSDDVRVNKEGNTDSDISFKRRQIIWKNVSRNGRLSYSDLKEEVKRKLGIADLPSQTIQGDLEFWKKLGFPLESVKPPSGDQRERIIVDTTSWQSTAKATRSLVHAEEKQMIAQACMGAICGFSGWSTAPNGDVVETSLDIDGLRIQIPKDLEQCYTRNQITAELARDRHPEAMKTAAFVSNRLHQFHLEMNRLIALDAGTTCTAIAAYISKLALPALSTKLGALSVCTNSRGIFQILGAPEVNCKTIIIGGEQRDRSEAIAGRLSEIFIQSAGILRFGITFLGATVVDTERMQCCSESQVLSRLKTILFGQSALRFVCVDHSKLVAAPMWASYPFAAINPEQIDLIVTDLPPIPPNFYELSDDAKQKCVASWSAFSLSIRKIEDHGVPVFLSYPLAMKLPKSPATLLELSKSEVLRRDRKKHNRKDRIDPFDIIARPEDGRAANLAIAAWMDYLGEVALPATGL